MPKLSKKNRKSLNNDDIVNLEDEFGSAPSNLNAASVLTAKRNTVYNRVETILKTFEKDLSAENSSQFKIFYERLSTYQEQFDELQAEILSLNASLPDDTQIEFKRTQGKFDSMIHSAETLYLSCCPKIAETASHDSSASSGASRGRIQLPKLPLPRFSGKLEDWRSFYNLFAASVHNEKELPTVRKFQYLLSSLEGSARDLVKGLDITETNYDVAWKLLCQRYQCERRHIYYHYNGLLGLPEIKDLKHIPNFLTKVREHTQALEGLDHKLQDYSSMLTAVITAKMTFYFRKRFDDYRGADVKYPKLESILDFLEKECLQIESSSMDSSSNKAQAKDSQVSRGTNSTSNPSKSHNSSHKVFLNSEIVESTNTCELCSGNHGLYKCNKFKRLSPSARKSKVIELRRCTNCLSKKHETAACASEYSCRFCKQQHHSLLCSNPRKNVDGASNSNSPPENIKVHLSSEFDTLPSRNFTSLLGTVLLNVKCPDNSYKPVRAIADSGAMSCFISYECVQRLELPMYATDAEISGIGNQAVKPLGEVKCTLKPRQNSEPILHARATVLSTITDSIPTQPVTPEVRKFWSQLELADPAFDQVGEIDMILGADLFPYILTGKRKLTERNGCALQSIYGWIIIGRVSTSKKPKRQKQKSFLSIDGLPLSADFKKFWETEEPQKHQVMSPDDIFCEQQFEKLHYRQPDGRYVVPLLLKNPNPVLPNSRALAENRLKSVERKLHKQPELKHAYKEFMNEYEQLGHMQLAPSSTEARYYIPHHAVVRENALSTRVRVVFDASMKASNGISLNENLHTGPKLQADIVHLLIRFRTHRVALTGDICKMFRQILIRPGPEDRQYQHILWRDDETSPPKDFELSTVTYGTGPAPYLAHRTMKQHSINERQEFPEACKVLDDAVYTDDIFTGHDTVEETVNLRVEITKCCEKGGFPVKKWSSSHAEVLEGLENGDMAIPLEFHNDAESTHGVVGVKWHPSSDTFSYNEVNLCGKLTKRGILSDIARIFDPLGYITPVALCAKIIIQQLWIVGADWDDPAPPDIGKMWSKVLSQLHLLTYLKIPRWIFPSKSKMITLIGFSDGSEQGYGATIYVRSENDEKFNVNLLIAKSKVAPVKPLSVPRLELSGANLLAKTFASTLKALEPSKYRVEKIVALTDSTTTLSWITTPPYKLSTYIANRVVSITEKLSPDLWYHVPGDENPSDLASRPVLPQNLVNNPLWWKGPNWLSGPEESWKITPIEKIKLKAIPELKNVKKAFIAQTTDILSRFSSLTRLRNSIAWCFRFVSNCRAKIDQKKKNSATKIAQGELSIEEVNSSMLTILKLVQLQNFAQDIQALRSGKTVSNQILSLNPFIDPLGVLRVGGRLDKSNLPMAAKHPAILPKNAHLTKLIIDFFHRQNLHAGPRLLQSIISQSYWILSARYAIKAQLHKCIICFRAAPRNVAPQMGQLPESRVVPAARCFLKVGTDFGGPYLIKDSKRRNAPSRKAYICLFICLATKAIHLELVSDLTTEAFIAALERFTSRRGMCTDIFSDNGSNFKGTNNYLDELYEFLREDKSNEMVTKHLTLKNIKWHFSPPTGSHFGGIWEAGIKSVKFHLKRILGDQKLTFEEFTTLLTRIEAILNSRPLCPISSDVEDLNVLTPAHFLIGGPLLSLPEYDWSSTPSNRLSRWQLLQQITQQYWKQWSLEYLNTLQQRAKWRTQAAETLAVGDLVLIKDENTPSLQWQMGRVIELHPGKDGIVRVASVKTTANTLRRPLVKLFRLPVD